MVEGLATKFVTSFERAAEVVSAEEFAKLIGDVHEPARDVVRSPGSELFEDGSGH
jgi:hypothetical protein